MARVETIKLSAVESVRLTREEGAAVIKVEFLVGTVPVVSKHLPAMVAGMLGDSLGFMANDCARPA